MSHLADGLLRRSLDEPESMGDADHGHLRGCVRCRTGLEAARADRDATAGLLHATVTAAPDADTAWAAVMDRIEPRPAAGGGTSEGHRAGPTGQPVTTPAVRRPRLGLRRPVVAAAAVAAIAIGSTAAAAAADLLPVFKPQKVAAVSFDVADLSALPDLASYGTASIGEGAEPRRVDDAAAAQARSGIAAPRVDGLPRGVTGRPSYMVIDRTTGRFTFSAAKARAAAKRAGRALPAMPAGIDGSVLQVQAGPGVVEVWGDGDGDAGIPELAVLRMTAPSASAQGVSLPQLRDYLLAQPGIPAATAAQLRALPDDGSVLPVPIPPQYATGAATTIDGVPATAVTLKDRSGSGIVWIKGGQLTAVLGLLGADEIQAVARGLH